MFLYSNATKQSLHFIFQQKNTFLYEAMMFKFTEFSSNQNRLESVMYLFSSFFDLHRLHIPHRRGTRSTPTPRHWR